MQSPENPPGGAPLGGWRAAPGGSPIIGWDVGGAHVKASLLSDGRIRDVAQWQAPLWQGLEYLDAAIEAAQARWPALPGARHAVTMTAEMTDLFADRRQGVLALAERLDARLGPRLAFFAGAAGWPDRHGVAAHWQDIASANWLATAELVAARLPEALLVDIGSTTTDLVPVRDHRPATGAQGDAARLAGGELVYVGAARTPLCALAARIGFDGRDYNVMNEFFATTADVFRITGELAADYDQHAAADGGAKDVAGSQARLARMIGMDAKDAPPQAWQALALAWRARLLNEIEVNLERVVRHAALPARAPVVGAGCGKFLARALAERIGRPFISFQSLAGGDAMWPEAGADWSSTCAPSVAVALLFDGWSSSCG